MTPQELVQLRERAREAWRTVAEPSQPIIWVSTDSGALASGASETLAAIRRFVAERGVAATVRETSAFGTTWLEPVVDIRKPGAPRVTYAHITADRVPDLLEAALLGDDARADLAYAHFGDGPYQGIQPLASTDWWRLQRRYLLARCGWADPTSLHDYLALDGFVAFEKALLELGPERVIEEVRTANIRGRGGAGFPAATKWEGARTARDNPKYVIVNSHEGEPNVFKDRRLMEGDPYGFVEGLMICAFAVGARQGYVYIGSEYPLALARVGAARDELRRVGLLGQNILGTDFSFDFKVVPGAGAYISGEASAAIYGIQGDRGMPRTKPPRSAEAGLWGKPTVVNNTETLANVPLAVRHGGEWYSRLGTEKSHGTKVFSLAGDIKHVGLMELEMGVSLRDLIFVAGGGMREGSRFRAVLAGGISGGALPKSVLDLPNEFGALEPEGSMMGSGGYIIYDERTCMVDLAFYCTRFNRDESCGKCVPCRVGTSSQLAMLENIKEGRATERHLTRLVQSSDDIIAYSLCGLGQAAPIPILSCLKHFREEFEEHIRERRCRAGVCNLHAAPTPRDARSEFILAPAHRLPAAAR
jgi:NADH:ubiquinone oxidoreductase subunit F (NADH-binding)